MAYTKKSIETKPKPEPDPSHNPKPDPKKPLEVNEFRVKAFLADHKLPSTKSKMATRKEVKDVLVDACQVTEEEYRRAGGSL